MAKPIFVFGSNQAGIHGAGAALYAKKYRGAQQGIGEGMTGNCYALPTKDCQIKTRKEEDIADSIKKFLEYAKLNPSLQFELTPIGCGLAGFKARDILDFIKELGIPKNILFSSSWFTDHNI